MENMKGQLKGLMQRSVTYLAFGRPDSGNGLDPQTVDKSYYFIKQWKFYFVGFMKDKPDLQKGDGSLLGQEGASLLANNILKAYYDQECRAFEEPTKGPYFEREPGALEYGDTSELFTDHRDALDRDENRNHWKQVQVAKVNTPWKQKQANLAQLMSLIIKHPAKRGRILRNAHLLASNGSITWNQYNKLARNSFELKEKSINSIGSYLPREIVASQEEDQQESIDPVKLSDAVFEVLGI